MKSYHEKLIFPFNLEELGIREEGFLQWLRPSFSKLAWDYYDLRKLQIDFLVECALAHQGNLEETFSEYYVTGKKTKDLDAIISKLSHKESCQFHALQPYRQREAIQFISEYQGNDNWSIEAIPITEFTQKVFSDKKSPDYRTLPRCFPGISKEVITHELYMLLLSKISNLVFQKYKLVKKLSIIAHHINVISRGSKPGFAAPEGIHQDGADCIVSALVVQKQNIKGGKSCIYSDDKKTLLYEKELEAGQGIFHPDRNSKLWHTVTPIVTSDEEKGTGVRSIIGFDINQIY